MSSQSEANLPTLVTHGTWQSVLKSNGQPPALANLLPDYIRARRWFRSKARQIKTVTTIDTIPLSDTAETAYITFVQVEYTEGDPEIYVLPLAFATGERAANTHQQIPHAAIAHVQIKDTGVEGLLYDPLVEPDFDKALLDMITKQRQLKGERGVLTAPTTKALQAILEQSNTSLEPTAMKAEQSNTSVIYGNRLIMKVFRRLEEGINPDLEIGRFLTEQRPFPHIPPVTGAIEYHPQQGEPMTVAILQGFVPNQGDAWRYTLEALGDYLERVLAVDTPPPEVTPLSVRNLLELAKNEILPLAREMIGTYIDSAQLLGQRTAEMHLALASEPKEPAFAPEIFTSFYQSLIYESMRAQAALSFQLLRSQMYLLPENLRPGAQNILNHMEQITARFQSVLNHNISAMRTRFHGDYHLGQVLYTGKDFAIIDFEGEPARPLSERRVKHSPLRDVAGMLRSFDYASYAGFIAQSPDTVSSAQDRAAAEAWIHFWTLWVSVAFLKGYLETAGKASFLPQTQGDLEVLLEEFLLDKALYELAYELNNRPDWAGTPIHGILQLIGQG